MLYNLVQATEKFKDVKSWQEVIKPLREPNSIDNRTDEEIEEQTIKEYNRIYGIE